MIFFEILGWIAIFSIAAAVMIVLIYMAAAVAMSFWSLFLMARAYVRGGKEGLRRHNELMKAKARD